MKYLRLGAVIAALVVICALAPAASAVVVHSPAGQFLGVAPRPGVAPASIPGSVAAAHVSPAASAASAGYSWQNLSYQGGPVLHSSDPYLIFWSPSGETIPGAWQSLIERYFSDVASDSTKASNVYAVGRQFTDNTGYADDEQRFDPGNQVVQDANPYPARDTTNCGASRYTSCLTDRQLQSEISSVITANGLPSDGSTGASELPSGAPVYFVILPSDVDVCFADGSGTCASNYFCAYHSDYADGPSNVLYATIPTLALGSVQDAKGCQWDGNSFVQEPNGSVADVALKYISHEDNETITDPLGTGWWNNYTGYENGDNCDDYETNSGAFAPVLGGAASAGTLYNQLIAGDRYYLQSEWSNGGSTCLMAPSSGALAPRFSVPAGPRVAGYTLMFDPGTSTSTYGVSSETWNFGDGSATTFSAGHALSAAAHAYTVPGDYKVTLTLIDRRGNLSTASEQISVGAALNAALTAAPTQLMEGSGPVTLDGSGSTDSGASIVSYAWDFGDGSTAQGASASHTYATAGTYLLRLTVTDSASLIDTATTTITVLDEPPTAAFSIAVPAPEAGQSVRFDGSSSSDGDGSITRYAWNFGDGHAATGQAPSHTYSSPGTYSVTLTVTDSSGQKVSASHQLTVLAGPSARFSPAAAQTVEGAPIAFDATGSAGGGTGAAITSYAWSFGDGATGTGATPSHAYFSPGTYTVRLTVSDSVGATGSATEQVSVVDELPTVAFGSTPTVPIRGQAITFDATGSADPDGAIVSYTWDFGDGTTGTGSAPSHAYLAAGTYDVRLTVLDRDGQRASTSKAVTVYAQPLVTFSSSPVLPVEHAPATFTAVSIASGPASMISSYAWSFGDGSTASGVSVTHAYAREGTYRITLTVTDGLGLASSTSEVVTVIDAAPVAVVSVLGRLRVPRHPITFSAARSYDSDEPIVGYLWHFGDGAGAVGKRVTHAFRRAGSYRVSLTVRDSFGQTATTTTVVRVGQARDVGRVRISPARRRGKA